jgi:hypothetical protein
VRVRVFLTRGREVLGEVPFRLGEVLPPRSATFWARTRVTEDVPPSGEETADAGPEGPALPGNGHSTADDDPLPAAKATVP